MDRLRARHFLAHLGIFCTFWVECALAEVPLKFKGTPDCADEASFVREVKARGVNLREGESSRRLVVRIHRRSETFEGILWVEGESGTSEPREVSAASCEDIVAGLAVVAAIALGAEGAETEEEEEAQPTALAQEPQLLVEDPAAPSTPTPQEGKFRGRTKLGGGMVTVPAGQVRFDPMIATSVHYGVTVGPYPVATTQATLLVDLAPATLLPSGEQRISGLIFRARLGLWVPPKTGVRSEGVRFEVGANTYGLGACLAPYYNLRGFVFLACLEMGIQNYGLSYELSDGKHREDFSMGYVGPSLELRYNIGRFFHVGAGLSGAVLAGGQFEPETVEAQNAFGSFISATLAGSLGIGAHF